MLFQHFPLHQWRSERSRAIAGLLLIGEKIGPYVVGAGVGLNCVGSFISVRLVRIHALRLQDRIIRSEVRQRLEQILPTEEHTDIQGFATIQLVGIRFASDSEMAALFRKAVDADIQDPTAIKKMVRDWQSDFIRVLSER